MCNNERVFSFSPSARQIIFHSYTFCNAHIDIDTDTDIDIDIDIDIDLPCTKRAWEHTCIIVAHSLSTNLSFALSLSLSLSLARERSVPPNICVWWCDIYVYDDVTYVCSVPPSKHSSCHSTSQRTQLFNHVGACWRVSGPAYGERHLWEHIPTNISKHLMKQVSGERCFLPILAFWLSGDGCRSFNAFDDVTYVYCLVIVAFFTMRLMMWHMCIVWWLLRVIQQCA